MPVTTRLIKISLLFVAYLFLVSGAGSGIVHAAPIEGPEPVFMPVGPVVEVFQFDETPLNNVLRLLSEMTERNVVATPQIQALPISIYLRDVTPMLALEVICKNYNLWFTEQDNIIRVMKVEEYGRELTLRRDERTEVFNLKYASCYTVGEAVSNVFGNRVNLVVPEEVESYGHVGTDEYPEVGEEADDIDIDEDGGDDDDGVRKKEKGVQELGGLKMDEADLAKLARVLRSGAEFSPELMLERQIGQARAQMTMFPRNNSIIIRSVDSNLVNDIAALIEKVDTPTRELLLEIKALRISLDDGMESYFNFDITNDNLSISSMGAATLTAPTFQFGFIDSEISAEMKLLESEGRITELSTPLMFVANNAAGRFFQGTEVSIRTGYTATEAQYNSEGTQTSPAQISVEYTEEEVGVTLEVSPSINEDRTVTMKILTEISSVNIDAGPAFYYTVGGATHEGRTDTISKTEIEDIVVAMDGQTLILGGLIEEVDEDVEDKVPVMGDIPLLSYFFKDTSKARRRTEIVFLLTPHIVMSPLEADKHRKEVMERLSDHPVVTQGQDRLLKQDQDTGVLESTVEGSLGDTPFPFNVGDAVRRLIHGKRTGGAVVEIGE